MITSQLTEVVDRQLVAYNNGDFSTFTLCYDRNIQSYDFETNKLVPSMCGESFFAHYEEKFAQNPEIFCEVTDRMVHDNLVVDKELIKGYNGKNHREMVIYCVENNLITKMWFSKEISE